ncbi:hypothetical protein G5I_09240 [Acromyrmex echinatior]|uniref:Uncharacterized protein n=1 Tax=Acromyrmex echinatior TaxID=103372 RepID=F4WTN4_ACREC|nr:hypothetical protein G5I_09240 [Acromyrmex echinatior]
MDSDAHFIAMHAGLIIQKQRHICVPDDELAKVRECQLPPEVPSAEYKPDAIVRSTILNRIAHNISYSHHPPTLYRPRAPSSLRTTGGKGEPEQTLTSIWSAEEAARWSLGQIEALSVPNRDVGQLIMLTSRMWIILCLLRIMHIMPCNDIDTSRSREPRMQKKFLFLGISAYMDHEEHVVASLMKRRKSFLIKESAARAIEAGCQLVKNTDRYPYVLNSMQQVFISAQYLPFPRNSLPT